MINKAAIKNKKTLSTGILALCALILVSIASYATVRFISRGDRGAKVANTENMETGNPNASFDKSEITNSKELPRDLPAGSPVYSDAKLTSASTSLVGGGEAKLYTLDFRTDKSLDEVFAYYTNAFENNGWDVRPAESSGVMRTLSANSAKNHTDAIVSGYSDDQQDGDTSYQLMLTVLSSSGS